MSTSATPMFESTTDRLLSDQVEVASVSSSFAGALELSEEERVRKTTLMRNILRLEVRARCSVTQARCTRFTLPHGVVETPMFMPVGTQGSVKGLTSAQLHRLAPPIVLGNTYHLGHRPGQEVMQELGGLHSFMPWEHNLLTDSGGFQMVSLLKLARITEEGVRFRSPHDGTEMVLTPEHSMQLQNTIGADIMMALDDVVSSTVSGPRVEEAMHRTLRWIDRCLAAHNNPERQCLFGIVQGGLDATLRDQCLAELIRRDLPGYAIGGLSGGESKDRFWRIVHQCARALPADKPRYLMGVGYAIDLVVCTALGVDLFDCVYPTRTARFGRALVDHHAGVLLSRAAYADDTRPIDERCDCRTCKHYSRAYLHLMVNTPSGSQLITYHNVAYQLRLMRRIQAALLEHRFPQFLQQFVSAYYAPEFEYPQWVLDALEAAGFDTSSLERRTEE